MGRVRSPEAEFAWRGFAAASTAARIWQSWPDDERIDLDAFEPVGDRFQALEALDQLRRNSPESYTAITGSSAALDRFLRVAGASSALAQALGRDARMSESLLEEPRERTSDEWRDFFEGWAPIRDGECSSDADQLRLANRAALISIAARDLSAEDPFTVVDSISRDLARVADQVLAISLALARTGVEGWRDARIAVIAFGKTGGEELNYLSDVDVIHVAEPADGVDEERALAIATQVAARQIRICSEHTRAGTIWPLDTALRPEGKAGALVRTLTSCKKYYEQWAKNWEFQAMLKGRPAAGDLALGQDFVDMLEPMVREAVFRDGFLHEMRAMRERVISLIPASETDRDIKLTAGGLRDTEFSVQLLQLVHGRADERIRARGTLQALEQLVEHGYIGRVDGLDMAQGYRFQRVLEHRAQLHHLRRTHLVPTDEATLAAIARTLGLTAPDMLQAWKASRREILRLRQRIFFSPVLATVANVPTESLLSPEAAASRMLALGFLDPRAALQHIEALTSGQSRAAEIRRQLMPAILEWIAAGPNPDFGLLSFRQLSEALGESSWYLRALRDEGFMAERLARVCSTSRYVVDLLKRAPETVQWLASTDDLQMPDVEALSEAMRQAGERNDSTDAAIASLRAMRRQELGRVALADALGEVSIDDCGIALSDIGTATIDAALSIARRDLDAPPIGVVALGRWGGREMSYASDADCMFVVDDDTSPEGIEAATKLVRRVADILAKPGPDPALLIDSNLRPEGKGGPQVRTLGSYLAYYDNWADTWERQLLLRARYGAGDRRLVERLLAGIDHFRYPEDGLRDTQLLEIRRLKSRMENERIPRGLDRNRHLKLGPGGLSDVEWTVQLQQLMHAHEHHSLRVTGTVEALTALGELGIVADEDATVLAEAWRFASVLRDSIMLTKGRPGEAMPSDTRELATMSALLGRRGPVTELAEEHRRLARRATGVVERLFWGSA